VKAYFRCTSYLLDNTGANVHVSDANGISALTWSCTVGNLDVCKALLRNGARVSLPHGQKTMSFHELRRAYVDRSCEEADHYVNSRLRHVMGEAEWRERHEKNKNMRLTVSPMMAALIKGRSKCLPSAFVFQPRFAEDTFWRCISNAIACAGCIIVLHSLCLSRVDVSYEFTFMYTQDTLMWCDYLLRRARHGPSSASGAIKLYW
jgi:hypothetical protein